ncbi:condensation domain-containing protein [Spirillospora sp. NPDC048824]|uniref:condensation domain-containing protein n=1 Tax=Spirillospora sp. NPDC048824 TaxID=3364526 RepID=UPI003715C485
MPQSDHPPVAQRVPLSAGQERLWVLDQMVPEGTYNVTECFRLVGKVDESALCRAAEALVARHEALRTGVDDETGTPEGRLFAPHMVNVDVMSQVAADDEELQRLLTAAALQPFDLRDGPLLRVAHFRQSHAPDGHVILLVLHHISVDGWSGAILRREFWTLYDDFAAGRAPRLLPLSATYAEYVTSQRRWLDGDEAKEQLAYWRERLARPPELLSFAGGVAGTPEPRRTDVITFALPADAVRAVREAGPTFGTTAFVVLLAGFAAALTRVTEADEFIVGTPVTDRPSVALEGVIGSFDNTVLLRIAPAESFSIREFVEHVRTVTLDAFFNKEIPFQHVVRALAPVRERGGTAPPLCNVAFSVEETSEERWSVHGAQVMPHSWIFRPPARFDLTLMAELGGDTITGHLYLDPDYVPRPAAERLARATTDALTQLSGQPDSLLRVRENGA